MELATRAHEGVSTFQFIQVRARPGECGRAGRAGVFCHAKRIRSRFPCRRCTTSPAISTQAAYVALAKILMPGGWFFLLDRMAVEAPLFEAYAALWARLEHTHGRSPNEGADYAAHQVMLAKAADTPLTAPDHLALLAEAGFTADVVYAHANRAVIAARKA